MCFLELTKFFRKSETLLLFGHTYFYFQAEYIYIHGIWHCIYISDKIVIL